MFAFIDIYFNTNGFGNSSQQLVDFISLYTVIIIWNCSSFIMFVLDEKKKKKKQVSEQSGEGKNQSFYQKLLQCIFLIHFPLSIIYFPINTSSSSSIRIIDMVIKWNNFHVFHFDMAYKIIYDQNLYVLFFFLLMIINMRFLLSPQ